MDRRGNTALIKGVLKRVKFTETLTEEVSDLCCSFLIVFIDAAVVGAAVAGIS